jgi:hypothetical protein
LGRLPDWTMGDREDDKVTKIAEVNEKREDGRRGEC